MAAAAAAAARSVLRSTGSAARLSATIKPSVAPSPFRISSQKPLPAPIFRSHVQMSSVSGGVSMSPYRLGSFAFSSLPGNVDQKNVACFSSCSKRFHRVQKKRIDVKRSTPAMGIVQGIEYDASRTSRIAPVRWEGVANQRKCNGIEEFALPKERLESTTSTTVRGPFMFSSLPGEDAGFNKNCTKDVLSSAFSSGKAKGETTSLSFSGNSVPRIAVAGAKPAFFALGTREEVRGKNTFSLSEIQKWRRDSILWTHRIKRKAAISWHSLRQQERLGLVRASKHNESKPKTVKNGKGKVNRVPVSYILASHQLKPGMTVMNWSKPSTS